MIKRTFSGKGGSQGKGGGGKGAGGRSTPQGSGGWPSTTGKPSGGGRVNAPSK